MSALVTLLFPEPTLRRQPAELFRWWESRRLTYNAVVGAAGCVTLAALELGIRIPYGLRQPFPWLGVAAYALAANVCYSLGCAAELLIQRWMGRETYGLGPALWRHGLVFSVGLTLIPVVPFTIGGVAWIIKTITG